MLWVTWHLYRRPALILMAALGVLALAAFMLGLQMDSDFQSSGLAACVAAKDHGGQCAGIADGFANRYLVLANLITTALVALPLLAGMFVGAPLLAQEFATGAHRLAWTQSISRYRWTLSKLSLIASAALVMGITFSAMGWWWQRPLDQLFGGPFAGFDVEAFTPVAYCFFAFAPGTAAGSIARNSVLAMGATLVVFLGLRFAVALLLRPNYISPYSTTIDLSRLQGSTLVRGGGALNINPDEAFFWAGDPSHPGDANNVSSAFNGDWRFNIHETGNLLTYFWQPADRFLPFQGVESAIFAALGLGLLGLTVWSIRRIS